RDPVRRVDRLLDQPATEGPGGRGIPPPYPEQGPHRQPDGQPVSRDLPPAVRGARGAVRSAGTRLPAPRVLRQAEAAVALLPPPRHPTHAGRHRPLPGPAPDPEPGTDRSGVQHLLRRLLTGFQVGNPDTTR